MTETTLRRGESHLNKPRTNHRNSATLNNFLEELHQDHVLDYSNFMYQYCPGGSGKGWCNEVTAVILSDPLGKQHSLPLDKLKAVGRQMGVPVFVVTHEPEDVKGKHNVDVIKFMPNGDVSDHFNITWRKANKLFQDCQFDHEEKGWNKSCNDYDDKWGNRAYGSNRDEDVSISNSVREIPGVRHLDMDAALLCPKCGHVVTLVEASSDEKKKTYMSRNVAARLKCYTLLLIHEKDDLEYEHDPRMSLWNKKGGVVKNGKISYVRNDVNGHLVKYDWDDVERIVRAMAYTHQLEDCTQR